MNRRIQKIEITHKTIIFTVFFLLGIALFFAIQDIILSIFISILIATAINPLVNLLEKVKIPRSLSAATILILLFIIIFAFIASLVPPIIAQTNVFIDRLPGLVDQLSSYQIDIPTVATQFGSLPNNLVKAATGAFSASLFLMTTFFMSFYITLERPQLEDRLKYFFGDNAPKAKTFVEQVEIKLGHWVRSELLLMLIVGLMTYIGLIAIGLDYALPLAIIAGFLELIPNLGPFISTIPAAIVGFATSPVHGLFVLLLYTLVQQLENNLIVPQLMKKTIGLHPIVTILALLIGFRLGGVLLAVLSLPLVLVAQLILTHWYQLKFQKA